MPNFYFVAYVLVCWTAFFQISMNCDKLYFFYILFIYIIVYFMPSYFEILFMKVKNEYLLCFSKISYHCMLLHSFDIVKSFKFTTYRRSFKYTYIWYYIKPKYIYSHLMIVLLYYINIACIRPLFGTKAVFSVHFWDFLCF